MVGGEYMEATGGLPAVLAKVWRRRVTEQDGVVPSEGSGFVSSMYCWGEPRRRESGGFDLMKRPGSGGGGGGGGEAKESMRDVVKRERGGGGERV